MKKGRRNERETKIETQGGGRKGQTRASPLALADEAAGHAWALKGGGEKEDWLSGGGVDLPARTRAAIIAGFGAFARKHPDAPAEALYRYGAEAFGLFRNRNGWDKLGAGARYAYRTFLLLARDAEPKPAEPEPEPTGPPPANRRLGKRIGKRVGRAGKRTKLTHARPE